MPGAVVRRKPCGEVPGGKWVAVGTRFGLASDALYNFDSRHGVLRATVVRSTRYADDVPTVAEFEPWRPATDLGEHKFGMVLTGSVRDLPRLARELEQPPTVCVVPAKKGRLPRRGSLAALHPASVQLLALKPAESGKGFILRVQAPAGRTAQVRLDWMGQALGLGPLRSGQIASWHLKPGRSSWTATPVDLAEQRLAPKPAARRPGRSR